MKIARFAQFHWEFTRLPQDLREFFVEPANLVKLARIHNLYGAYTSKAEIESESNN